MGAWRSQLRTWLWRAGRYLAHGGRPRLDAPGLQARLGRPDRHVFFGYHDVTPFDPAEGRVLAHLAPPLERHPGPGEAAAVGWFDLAAPEIFHEIDRTEAWCWQQGARLQWFEPGRSVLYNRRDGACARAVIRPLAEAAGEGGIGAEEERVLDAPVYALKPDRSEALSLDFARLHRLRPGYGYGSLTDATVAERAPASSGVSRIDLASGAVAPVLSLAEIAAVEPTEEMAGAQHGVNHLQYAPNGDGFVFFHMWVTPRGKRRVRMMAMDGTAATNGQAPWARVLIDYGTPCHFCFLDAERLVVVVHSPAPGEPDYHYRLVHFADGRGEALAGAWPDADGHPMASPRATAAVSLPGRGLEMPDARRWILTDTYPDRARDQHLYLLSLPEGKRRRLGTFYAPPRLAGPCRCDLHPRWSPSGHYVAVDTAASGRREMLVLRAASAEALGVPGADSSAGATA